jgi:hypothetical protein
MATKTATPWGPATVIEEVSLPQKVGDKRFSSLFQLLENDAGERFVRFAYSTGGTARRGPVTLRAADMKKLRKAVERRPGLGEALGLIERGDA